MIIKAKKLHPDATLPRKSRPGDAAWDLACAAPIVLRPGGAVEINTAVAVELPPGFFGLILGRSGLAREGIGIVGGCIDCEYRGPLIVVLVHHGAIAHHFRAGDRVAQLAVLPLFSFAMEEADDLSPSDRGESGFGSSGR